jgi:hypothetical protein
MRSSRLAQSYSSEVVSPIAPTSFMTSGSGRHADRKKVLITRLFPVILLNDDELKPTPMSQVSEGSAGFPFPTTPDELPLKKKKPQPKQKRTPMYAVVLVIQLPTMSSQLVPPSTAKSGFRGPSSYTDQGSFPSSFNSGRRSGWTMVGAGLYNESLEPPYPGDVEDRLDSLTQHWDIIMRTLTHLQSVIATTLGNMLKQADLASPDPFPASMSAFVARTPSLSGRRGDEPQPLKPPKSNAKLVTLLPNSLIQDQHVSQEIDNARSRIVTGLRATRVVTGQGRWGIWREEARWMAKWSAEEHCPFFQNLLTGFLATHTDWLQALGPAWYRKRHYEQQKAKGEEDLSLPARTVIVAQDKMAARRMVFLLSAFLPANQQLPSARTHRPSTSASHGQYSHSPPTAFVVPILREESLRRKINRRTGPRRGSHSRTASQSTRSSGVPAQLAHLSMEGHHERRFSDAAPIRTSTLPIPGNDLVSRKSSAATTATITPETTVAHLATINRADSRRSARPGSSGSVAADDLKRTLKRGESTGQSSIGSTDSRSQSSRWGSVISGLWSARRRDSTNMTTQSHHSGGAGDNPPSPSKFRTMRSDKLADMVREVSAVEEQGRDSVEVENDGQGPDPETPRGMPDEQHEGFPSEILSQMKRTPDPAGAFESPVKTSINIDDGVIDVDIPFPDYITSFETAVSSPSSSGYLSTPGFGSGALEGFEQSSRVGVDGDLPLNVAGWLQTYHPDFALQAIPPQDDLKEQVKASLRAEPSPAVSQHVADQLNDRWVDISTAIVADTVNFTVTRIRYRRLIRPKMAALPGPIGSGLYSGALLTPSIMPYEQQLEEEFIEESINSLDETLVAAVDRIMAQAASDAGKGSSSGSSPSDSRPQDQSDGDPSQPEETVSPEEPRHPPPVFQEVPRGECKTVILSALSEIIREVIDKREKELQSEAGLIGEREKENALREAVRAWVEGVEMGE